MTSGTRIALLAMALLTMATMVLYVTLTMQETTVTQKFIYESNDVMTRVQARHSTGTDNKPRNCTDFLTAEELAEKVPVVCMVLTCPAMLDNRTRYVQQTWAKRCNAIEFISSQTNKSFPTIGLPVPDGQYGLAQKVLLGTRLMYEKYFKNRTDFDWLFMADDDTYAIMENLRYFLREKDPEQLVYYGHHFKQYVPGGYPTGGAGVAIGRGILHKLFTTETREVRGCINRTGKSGDTHLALCLNAIGAVVGQSTDISGNSRFHHFTPWTHMQDRYPTWYYAHDYNGPTHGLDKISHYAITFHYIEGPMMLEYDYFLYHLRPFGLVGEDLQLNSGASIGHHRLFGLLQLSSILIVCQGAAVVER